MSEDLKDWFKILLPMIFIALTSFFSTKQSIAVIEERISNSDRNYQSFILRISEAQARAIRNSLEIEKVKASVSSIERELDRGSRK